jgi:hypothetical protein
MVHGGRKSFQDKYRLSSGPLCLSFALTSMEDCDPFDEVVDSGLSGTLYCIFHR